MNISVLALAYLFTKTGILCKLWASVWFSGRELLLFYRAVCLVSCNLFVNILNLLHKTMQKSPQIPL